MSLYKNKYRIEPARLIGFDYGSNAAYFITICTKNRINYFGNIVDTHDYASSSNNSVSPSLEPHDYVAQNDYVAQKKEMFNSNKNETDNLKGNETDNLSGNETDNYPSLQATMIAKIAEKFWNEIPQHYPFVLLDEFIIMPNHIHGIIIINKNTVETHDYASNDNKTDNRPSLPQWQENKFGVQSKNIPAIVRGFKSSVKRFANLNNIEFEWQSRYYDRIIRDDEEFNNIRNYIYNNPKNWVDDENYSP
jgi:putative transposase